MMISGKFESLLKTADSICVLTGAGISAESGVATFRGTDGLWSKLRPEELANFDAFLRNPDIVWEWYNHRKQIIQEVKPNAAHYALADMEQMVKDFTLTTQNIDNLHIRAGSKRVMELHGNIERSYCVTCGKFVPDVVVTREQRIPHCDDCGGVIRPDVVWFGEMLPQDVLEESMSAAARCSLFLTIGTSAVVYPAAGLPLKARDCGAYVVEINLERTEISHLVDESLIGKAGEILPQLAEIMKTSRSQK
jgi:NAD-dependent deacetylase